jgi:hypothetical protein
MEAYERRENRAIESRAVLRGVLIGTALLVMLYIAVFFFGLLACGMYLESTNPGTTGDFSDAELQGILRSLPFRIGYLGATLMSSALAGFLATPRCTAKSYPHATIAGAVFILPGLGLWACWYAAVDLVGPAVAPEFQPGLYLIFALGIVATSLLGGFLRARIGPPQLVEVGGMPPPTAPTPPPIPPP